VTATVALLGVGLSSVGRSYEERIADFGLVTFERRYAAKGIVA
jgi:hypothetical protein